MRVRTVVSGILAGVICYPVLWVYYYQIAPAGLIPGWMITIPPPLPVWTPVAIYIFCGVTIFAFGWVSVRWNWARNWQASLLAGAGAGALAGCLTYDFIGTFWIGLYGQREILHNFNTPISEADGMRILIEAIFQTGTSLYLNFIFIFLACTIAGSLGGLVSALVDVKDFWGKKPRQPEGWLFRLPAYTLVVSGVLNMIVTIAVLQTLWQKAMDSAIEINNKYHVQWTVQPPSEAFLVFAYLAGLLFILLPIGITWGWFIKNWKIKGKLNALSVPWMLVTIAGAAYILSRYTYYPDFLIFVPIVLVGGLLGGIPLGLMTDLERMDGSKPTFSDWIGHGLAFGILGGTQIIVGAPAFALSLSLIAIVNIPHLVGTGLVEQSPVDQVSYLYGLLTNVARGLIIACFILGLMVAWLTSLFRSILGIKDLPPPDKLQTSL